MSDLANLLFSEDQIKAFESNKKSALYKEDAARLQREETLNKSKAVSEEAVSINKGILQKDPYARLVTSKVTEDGTFVPEEESSWVGRLERKRRDAEARGDSKTLNSINNILASVYANKDQDTSRSTGEAAADMGRNLSASTGRLVGTVVDMTIPDATGRERPIGLFNSPTTDYITKAKNRIEDAALQAVSAFPGIVQDLHKLQGIAPSTDAQKGAMNFIEGLGDSATSEIKENDAQRLKTDSARTAAGLPTIAEENASQLTSKFNKKVGSIADKIQDFNSLHQKTGNAKLSKAMDDGFVSTLDHIKDNLGTIVTGPLTESAPYLAVGMGAGNVARVAGASGEASTMAAALSGSTLDVMSGAADAERVTAAMSPAALAKTQAFADLKKAHPTATPAQLRDLLIKASGDTATGVGLPVAVLLSTVGTKLGLNPVEAALANASKTSVNTSIGKKAVGAVLNAGKEAVGEIPEEASNQLAQASGEVAGGARKAEDRFDGVAGAGALGGALGVVTSGGISTTKGAVDAGNAYRTSRRIEAADTQAPVDNSVVNPTQPTRDSAPLPSATPTITKKAEAPKKEAEKAAPTEEENKNRIRSVYTPRIEMANKAGQKELAVSLKEHAKELLVKLNTGVVDETTEEFLQEEKKLARKASIKTPGSAGKDQKEANSFTKGIVGVDETVDVRAKIEASNNVNALNIFIKQQQAKIKPDTSPALEEAILDEIDIAKKRVAKLSGATTFKSSTDTISKPATIEEAQADYEVKSKDIIKNETERKGVASKLEELKKEVKANLKRAKKRPKVPHLLQMLGKRRLLTSDYSSQVGNKDNFRTGGAWAHTKSERTGMSLHQLREWMEEMGYLPEDSYDDDALQLYTSALRGEEIYSSETAGDRADMMSDDRYDEEIADEITRLQDKLAELEETDQSLKTSREESWKTIKALQTAQAPVVEEAAKVIETEETAAVADARADISKAKRFKDMSFFEKMAIAYQINSTTDAKQLKGLLGALRSGKLSFAYDEASKDEGEIKTTGDITINLAQFTRKNLAGRRARQDALITKARKLAISKDKAEVLAQFYNENMGELLKASSSVMDVIRHELRHSKDFAENTNWDAVDRALADDPLWKAMQVIGQAAAPPGTGVAGQKTEALGYYITAMSMMHGNPALQPLLYATKAGANTYEEVLDYTRNFDPVKQLQSIPGVYKSATKDIPSPFGNLADMGIAGEIAIASDVRILTSAATEADTAALTELYATAADNVVRIAGNAHTDLPILYIPAPKITKGTGLYDSANKLAAQEKGSVASSANSNSAVDSVESSYSIADSTAPDRKTGFRSLAELGTVVNESTRESLAALVRKADSVIYGPLGKTLGAAFVDVSSLPKDKLLADVSKGGPRYNRKRLNAKRELEREKNLAELQAKASRDAQLELGTKEFVKYILSVHTKSKSPVSHDLALAYHQAVRLKDAIVSTLNAEDFETAAQELLQSLNVATIDMAQEDTVDIEPLASLIAAKAANALARFLSYASAVQELITPLRDGSPSSSSVYYTSIAAYGSPEAALESMFGEDIFVRRRDGSVAYQNRTINQHVARIPLVNKKFLLQNTSASIAAKFYADNNLLSMAAPPSVKHGTEEDIAEAERDMRALQDTLKEQDDYFNPEAQAELEKQLKAATEIYDELTEGLYGDEEVFVPSGDLSNPSFKGPQDFIYYALDPTNAPEAGNNDITAAQYFKWLDVSRMVSMLNNIEFNYETTATKYEHEQIYKKAKARLERIVEELPNYNLEDEGTKRLEDGTPIFYVNSPGTGQNKALKVKKVAKDSSIFDADTRKLLASYKTLDPAAKGKVKRKLWYFVQEHTKAVMNAYPAPKNSRGEPLTKEVEGRKRAAINNALAELNYLLGMDSDLIAPVPTKHGTFDAAQDSSVNKALRQADAISQYVWGAKTLQKPSANYSASLYAANKKRPSVEVKWNGDSFSFTDAESTAHIVPKRRLTNNAATVLYIPEFRFQYMNTEKDFEMRGGKEAFNKQAYSADSPLFNQELFAPERERLAFKAKQVADMAVEWELGLSPFMPYTKSLLNNLDKHYTDVLNAAGLTASHVAIGGIDSDAHSSITGKVTTEYVLVHPKDIDVEEAIARFAANRGTTLENPVTKDTGYYTRLTSPVEPMAKTLEARVEPIIESKETLTLRVKEDYSSQIPPGGVTVRDYSTQNRQMAWTWDRNTDESVAGFKVTPVSSIIKSIEERKQLLSASIVNELTPDQKAPGKDFVLVPDEKGPPQKGALRPRSSLPTVYKSSSFTIKEAAKKVVTSADFKALIDLRNNTNAVSAVRSAMLHAASVSKTFRFFTDRKKHASVRDAINQIDSWGAVRLSEVNGAGARFEKALKASGLTQEDANKLSAALTSLDEMGGGAVLNRKLKASLRDMFSAKVSPAALNDIMNTAAELRYAVDQMVTEIASRSLGPHTYDAAPQALKDSYDALIDSRGQYLTRTYHRFSITSAQVWENAILRSFHAAENSLDARAREEVSGVGTLVLGNTSAKAATTLNNAVEILVADWNGELATVLGPMKPDNFEELNDEQARQAALSTLKKWFIENKAEEQDILLEVGTSNKGAGVLKARILEGDENAAYRALLGEIKDYASRTSASVARQVEIVSGLEVLKTLYDQGVIIPAGTNKNSDYVTLPNSAVYTGFNGMLVRKDFYYTVREVQTSEGVVELFRRMIANKDVAAGSRAAFAVLDSVWGRLIGYFKMATVFTNPNLWLALGSSMLSYGAKATLNPYTLAKGYRLAQLWLQEKSGSSIDPNDPLYEDYKYIIGAEIIDSAVFAEIAVASTSKDLKQALELIGDSRSIASKTGTLAETVKEAAIDRWTYLEAIPKIAAALQFRKEIEAFNQAQGLPLPTAAEIGVKVRREFPSAKDVPAIAKYTDRWGITMFMGFFYQVLHSATIGLGANLTDAFRMIKAANNPEATKAAALHAAGVMGRTVAQYATIAGILIAVKSLLGVDDDDLDKEELARKRMAEAMFAPNEIPEFMVYVGESANKTPLFINLQMVVDPLDTMHSMVYRSLEAVGPDARETIPQIMFDSLPLGFVGDKILADKRNEQLVSRAAGVGILKVIRRIKKDGMSPTGDTMRDVAGTIMGIREVDPFSRIAYSMLEANSTLDNTRDANANSLKKSFKELMSGSESYNVPEMKEQLQGVLDASTMAHTTHYNNIVDAYKASGMSKGEFATALKTATDTSKLASFAYSVASSLEKSPEEAQAFKREYIDKAPLRFYEEKLKKGALDNFTFSPQHKAGFNARGSVNQEAIATRNKTSFEAVLGQEKKPIGEFSGRVTGVHDADTLYIRTSEGKDIKVRLQNVDAAELDQILSDGTPIGKKGQAYLSDLVLNKDVRGIQYGTDKRGRALARVITNSGRDAGVVVAEQGYAIVTDIDSLEEYPTTMEDKYGRERSPKSNRDEEK